MEGGATLAPAPPFLLTHPPTPDSLAPPLSYLRHRIALAARLRSAEATAADAQARVDGLAARVAALEGEAAGLRRYRMDEEEMGWREHTRAQGPGGLFFLRAPFDFDVHAPLGRTSTTNRAPVFFLKGAGRVHGQAAKAEDRSYTHTQPVLSSSFFLFSLSPHSPPQNQPPARPRPDWRRG